MVVTDPPAVLAGFLLSAHTPIEYTALADPDRVANQAIGLGDDSLALVVDGTGIGLRTARRSDHRNHPGYQTILDVLHRADTASN